MKIDNGELASFIAATLSKTNHRAIPVEYERLNEKYDLHRDGVWIKNKIREIFMGILFKTDYSKDFIVRDICHNLKRFGKIRFDLDGLKSINDIGNHRLGDILLDRVVAAMRSQKISNFCDQFGLHIEIDRAGGDEFDFFVEKISSGTLEDKISFEDISDRSIFTALRMLINREVIAQPFTEMDFHLPEIQEKLGEFGCSLLKKAEKNSRKKFCFTPSVSSGEILFWNAFLHFIKNNGNFAYSTEMVGDLLMGLVEDLSSDLVTKRKNALKKALWKSPKPENNMQGFLITRSASDKEVAILIHNLRKIHRQRTALTEEIYCLQSTEKELDCNIGHTKEDIGECIKFVMDKVFILDREMQKLLS